MRFAWWRWACVRCRIGGNRREACQSGRMGLTANELSALKRTGGSNPLASAGADSSATQLNTTCARSSTDRASDYGSEGWGFESLRARSVSLELSVNPPPEFGARSDAEFAVDPGHVGLN